MPIDHIEECLKDLVAMTKECRDAWNFGDQNKAAELATLLADYWTAMPVRIMSSPPPDVSGIPPK